MKLVSKNALLAAMLAAASVGAFAADSVDLKVIGKIVPASCTPTLAGGGIVDLGNISAKTLSDTAFTILPDHYVDLNISCNEPARVAIKITDNRQASIVSGIVPSMYAGHLDSQAFGLGTVAGKNVGSYEIERHSVGVTVDGQPASRVFSTDNGASWTVTTSTVPPMQSGTSLYSWGPSQSATPGAFTTMTQPLRVLAGLNNRANLPDLTNEVPLDGSATISLVYL